MPVEMQAAAEDFVGFERGIDRESPRTAITRGGYDNAVDMLLTGTSSGRTPSTVWADAPLDALVTWPAGTPTWVAPFTYSTYSASTKTLTFSTHLLIARTTGQIHRYDPASTANVA